MSSSLVSTTAPTASLAASTACERRGCGVLHRGEATPAPVTSSNGTRLARAGRRRIPGVVAAATGATGELALTPSYAKITSVTAAATSP